jgi:hypothetical protein
MLNGLIIEARKIIIVWILKVQKRKTIEETAKKIQANIQYKTITVYFSSYEIEQMVKDNVLKEKR